MRTLFPVILVGVMLAGCATTGRRGEAATDAQRVQCRAEADAAEVSGLRKALIYSSNIVVFPVTTALTLGLGSVFVYPMSDDAWKARTFEQCMANLGG